ncbi:hypothetical protein [Tepidibacillus marianensis]|uniref:hypothetical protein n=1 Tax=Tepidibacillus marianensis TaxID=3131995 RepID=UPI0030CDC329
MVLQTPWALAYLQYLQVPVQQPSYPYLNSIYQAHLKRIPFENVTKIIQYSKGLHESHEHQWIPDIETFVDRLHQWKSGGIVSSKPIALNNYWIELDFRLLIVSLNPTIL